MADVCKLLLSPADSNTAPHMMAQHSTPTSISPGTARKSSLAVAGNDFMACHIDTHATHMLP